MNKKKAFILLVCTAFSIAVLCLGFIIYVIRQDTKFDEPKYWPPFVSFYRSEQCYRNKNATQGCLIGGHRAYAYDEKDNDSIIKLLENMQLEMGQIKGGKIEVIGPFDPDQWKCNLRSYNRNGINDVDLKSFIPLNGDLLECWPIKPLNEGVGPFSKLYQ